MSNRLLPYDTIIKAHEGDPIAIQAVLDRDPLCLNMGENIFYANLRGYSLWTYWYKCRFWQNAVR